MERSPPGEQQDREGAGTNPYAVLSVRVLSGFTPLRSKSRLERQSRATNGCSANLATRRCSWKCATPPYVRQRACALLWVLWLPNVRPKLILLFANSGHSSENSPGSCGCWSFLPSCTWPYLSFYWRYRNKAVPYLVEPRNLVTKHRTTPLLRRGGGGVGRSGGLYVRPLGEERRVLNA
jgi:hypothetical protein